MNKRSTLIIDAFWVSNKPFPTAQNPNSGDGRAFYDYYLGTARHLGWMDLVLLKSIIKKHNITHIILQNLDTLGMIGNATGEVKICTSYNYNKFSIVVPVLEEKELVHCQPFYDIVEFGGWYFTNDSNEIPLRAKVYMSYLLIHTHVKSITCMTNRVKVTAHFDETGHVLFDTEEF